MPTSLSVSINSTALQLSGDFDSSSSSASRYDLGDGQTYKLTCTITSGSFVTPAKPSVGFSNSGVVFRVLEADVNTAGDTLSIWVVGLLDGLMPMDGSVTVSTEVDNSGVSTATGSCAISSIAVPVFPEA